MGTSANLLLRLGVAFAFLYPPVDALFDPASWLGYFPQFVHRAAQAAGIADPVLLHGFGLLEVVIALWILFGKKVHWPAAAAAAILVAIVILDGGDFQILFRDLSIALCAAALAVDAWSRSEAAAG